MGTKTKTVKILFILIAVLQNEFSIFLVEKPTQPTYWLGTILLTEKEINIVNHSIKKIKLNANNKEFYQLQFDSIITRIKKEYPQAKGMIFTTFDMSKADIIKFK